MSIPMVVNLIYVKLTSVILSKLLGGCHNLPLVAVSLHANAFIGLNNRLK
jgi:hypothetical protein